MSPTLEAGPPGGVGRAGRLQGGARLAEAVGGHLDVADHRAAGHVVGRLEVGRKGGDGEMLDEPRRDGAPDDEERQHRNDGRRGGEQAVIGGERVKAGAAGAPAPCPGSGRR